MRRRLPLERRKIGRLVRLGINAREVLSAAPNKHLARSRLSKPLWVLNETEGFGRPLTEAETEGFGRPQALTEAELAVAKAERSAADPKRRGWRTIAKKLNAARRQLDDEAGRTLTERLPDVSHMAVKRDLERAQLSHAV